jgi:spore coat polysaccharide biosynthesis predicted glycosyltransferase SpsG
MRYRIYFKHNNFGELVDWITTQKINMFRNIKSKKPDIQNSIISFVFDYFKDPEEYFKEWSKHATVHVVYADGLYDKCVSKTYLNGDLFLKEEEYYGSDKATKLLEDMGIDYEQEPHFLHNMLGIEAGMEEYLLDSYQD